MFLKGIIRRLAHKAGLHGPSVITPGPIGDAFRSEQKRIQTALASPVADRMAQLEEQQVGFPANIPFERTVYRNSQGMILTPSLIARGIGAGTMMSPAAELTDQEAETLVGHLERIVDISPFEQDLVKEIKTELSSRWV